MSDIEKDNKCSLFREYYESGNIFYETIIDINGHIQGEYISYHDIDGAIENKCFCKDNKSIGINTFYKKDGSINIISFCSMINLGERIDEHEHKKELAMLRLGLIDVPEFGLFIKDYEGD